MSRSSCAALALLLAAALGGCARSYGRLVEQPLEPGRPWASSLHRDHPLVGRIWDVRGGRFVDEAALVAAASGAEVVLLGEVHDNPDHHVLQARVVQAIAAGGKRPAVAFEMLSAEQQATIDAALAADRVTADTVGKALAWDRSGWPPFAMYRPVFAAALAARLPLVGANLPRAQVRDVVRKGADALPATVKARIDRVGPPSPEEAKALRDEMLESHCGELPEVMLDPMVLAQRARDAQMADRVEAAGAGRGAVLVTGSGHARVDRGVARYLEASVRARTLAIAFQEVLPEEREPSGYARDEAGAVLPFDLVVFTPATEREDPCADFTEKRKARDAPAKPGAPASG